MGSDPGKVGPLFRYQRSAVAISVVRARGRLPYWRRGSRSSPAPFGAVGLLKQGLRLGECPYGQAAKAYNQAGHRASGRGGRGTSGGCRRPEVPAEPVGHLGRGVDLSGSAPRPCRECGRHGSRFQALPHMGLVSRLPGPDHRMTGRRIMSAIGTRPGAPERLR